MRISDWSSDVCSSDLLQPGESFSTPRLGTRDLGATLPTGVGVTDTIANAVHFQADHADEGYDGHKPGFFADRKSVVEGKSVSVRVDLGGRRIIKKNKKQIDNHKKQPRSEYKYQ